MSADLTYLLARAGLVEDEVRALVQRRRAADPAPDDPFRGLYVSDETVDELLTQGRAAPSQEREQQGRAEAEREADRAEERGEVVRLRRLARAAELSDLDVQILMVALLPDLDTRFERLYGYLNDDVTRRRPDATSR